MHVCFDTTSRQIIATGDRIDCIAKALKADEFGSPAGQIEALQHRIETLELTIAALFDSMPDDVLNTFLLKRGLVIYNDDTVPSIIRR